MSRKGFISKIPGTEQDQIPAPSGRTPSIADLNKTHTYIE